MKCCVFAYDFPHRKFHDFINILAGKLAFKDIMVIAAPYKELPVQDPLIKIQEIVPGWGPKQVAEDLSLNYFVCPHEDCLSIIKRERPEIGVIAGARIIPEEVINAFPRGILNFHNGILPENKGLDCMKYAVLWWLPQGVTAHFIDKTVDGGHAVCEEILKVTETDTFQSIADRLYLTQVKLLSEVFPRLDEPEKYLPISLDIKPHSHMTREQEFEVMHNFPVYKANYQSIAHGVRR